MTLDEKFSQLKKQIGLFLIENGFKKVKSHYRREFKDSRCVFLLIKPRGYSDESVICWQLVGGIFFNALDPIFRTRGLPDHENTACLDKNFNTTTDRAVSFWEITNESNVDDLVESFKKTNHHLFEQLEKTADIHEYAAWSIDYNLKLTRGYSNQGLLEATALAKFSGKKHEYELLLKIIEERDVSMSYMNSHLALIKESKTLI
jgi:hypothetical protein